MMLFHRCKTHAAISENDGRHSMPARGRKQRIPHRLTVVVRVYVDPARRNHQPRGIDLAPSRSLLPANPGDPAFCNGNVAAKCGLAGAIQDRAATNNDVVHANLPHGVAPPRPRRNLFAFDEYRLTVGRETWARGIQYPSLAATLRQFP